MEERDLWIVVAVFAAVTAALIIGLLVALVLTMPENSDGQALQVCAYTFFT